VEMVLADQGSRDRNDAAQRWTIGDWLRAHPGDPDGPGLQRFLENARRSHLAYGRQYLDWGYLRGACCRETNKTNNRKIGKHSARRSRIGARRGPHRRIEIATAGSSWGGASSDCLGSHGRAPTSQPAPSPDGSPATSGPRRARPARAVRTTRCTCA
jgi:hypothetical protein